MAFSVKGISMTRHEQLLALFQPAQVQALASVRAALLADPTFLDTKTHGKGKKENGQEFLKQD